MFYNRSMPNTLPKSPDGASLSFRIGRWAEARATGWGVAALVVLAALAAAVILSGRLVLPH
jgi:hypothetical protein